MAAKITITIQEIIDRISLRDVTHICLTPMCAFWNRSRHILRYSSTALGWSLSFPRIMRNEQLTVMLERARQVDDRRGHWL